MKLCVPHPFRSFIAEWVGSLEPWRLYVFSTTYALVSRHRIESGLPHRPQEYPAQRSQCCSGRQFPSPTFQFGIPTFPFAVQFPIIFFRIAPFLQQTTPFSLRDAHTFNKPTTPQVPVNVDARVFQIFASGFFIHSSPLFPSFHLLPMPVLLAFIAAALKETPGPVFSIKTLSMRKSRTVRTLGPTLSFPGHCPP